MEVLYTFLIEKSYFLMRSKRILRVSEKKNLASTEMIKRSAKIRKAILINSTPLKLQVNPIIPVNIVIIRKGII